jgi:preprotein translocase subunit SecG
MAWVTTLLIVVQVLSAIGIIVLVLLQHGKGADMGAAFGGGASGSLFGATGSANFLSRSTAAAATLFFVATLGLAFTATNLRTVRTEPTGVMGTVPAAPASTETTESTAKDVPAPAKEEAPAAAPGKAGEIPSK